MVDDVFQFLAGFEKRDLLCRNFYSRPGFGVPAHARLALPRPETAKAADFYLIPGTQGSYNTVEDGFDNDLTVFARKLRQA
jgi:hypothetical protein